MDLGITGRWAIVCAASQGLGKGCAEALGKEGVNLVINARTQATLMQTASELRAACPGIEVLTVAGDVADARCARRCWRPARRSTSWSTTPVARHRGTSVTGGVTTG